VGPIKQFGDVILPAERIEAVMPRLDEMVKEGLVTLERVQVVAYRAQARQDDQDS
jgi:PII-like signaling protein